jgi:hypothetical protein
VAAVGGLNKFKMAAIAMVTKVQKMLNSLYFCVFQFLSILAVSMATAAILKK